MSSWCKGSFVSCPSPERDSRRLTHGSDGRVIGLCLRCLLHLLEPIRVHIPAHAPVAAGRVSQSGRRPALRILLGTLSDIQDLLRAIHPDPRRHQNRDVADVAGPTALHADSSIVRSGGSLHGPIQISEKYPASSTMMPLTATVMPHLHFPRSRRGAALRETVLWRVLILSWTTRFRLLVSAAVIQSMAMPQP